jgi:hypothetical protein
MNSKACPDHLPNFIKSTVGITATQVPSATQVPLATQAPSATPAPSTMQMLLALHVPPVTTTNEAEAILETEQPTSEIKETEFLRSEIVVAIDSSSSDSTPSAPTSPKPQPGQQVKQQARPPAQLAYYDPQAIYQRYVKARAKWYRLQPPGSIKTNQKHRKAMGLPARYSKEDYNWCLDWKQMKKRCKRQRVFGTGIEKR